MAATSDDISRSMIVPIAVDHNFLDSRIYDDDFVTNNVVLGKDIKEIEEIRAGSADPFRADHEHPFRFCDGILAPRPMKIPEDWEPMGRLEYRALYYTICKFNQVSRTGIEYKSWGDGPDQKIFSFIDTTPYCYATSDVFLSLMQNVLAPVARKCQAFQEQFPKEWDELLQKMDEVCGAPQAIISVKQFMELAKLWKKAIGVPRDFHAACADFVPGTYNILHLQKCVLMHEYDSHLAVFGGTPFGDGKPCIPNDPMPPSQPRPEKKMQAILFEGDGSEKLGMMKYAAELPRVAEKLARAKEILGFDLLEVCVNGPENKLEEHQGVAMYMAGWAAYEKFLDEDPMNARACRAVAGIDLGEFVALSVAGVLPFEAGLELAHFRSLVMKEIWESNDDQAICSVAGLKEDRVKQLCALAIETRSGRDKDKICQINTGLFNRGFVVAGNLKVIETFQQLAVQDGAAQAKVRQTKADHTPLMENVQWVIKSKLREWRHKMGLPWCDIYFNSGGEDRIIRADIGNQDPAEALEDVIAKTTEWLSEVCYKACRWDVVMTTMLKHGYMKFYECAPVKQLKMLMKRINEKGKAAFENMENYIV